MPKFVKAKLLNPEINYGYQLYITTVEELIDYFEVVKSTKLAEGFRDVFRVHAAEYGHFRTDMSKLINIRCGNVLAHGNPEEKSVLDVTLDLGAEIFGGMGRALLDAGNVLIGVKGGWNFASPGHLEVYGKVLERDKYVWPNEEPITEIKKWPGGKHWYVYVNGEEVGTKYDFYYQAEDVLKKHLKK